MTPRGTTPRGATTRGPRHLALGSLLAVLVSAACGSEREAAPFGVVRPGDAGSSATAGRTSTASAGRGGRASGGTGAGGLDLPAGAAGEGLGGLSSGANGGEGGEPDAAGAGAGGSSAGSAGGSAGSGTGIEACTNGLDDDGDDAADCADADCAGICAATCDAFELVQDPALLQTSNADRAPAPAGDCGAEGPALTYEVVVETTGVFEVDVQSSALFVASLAGACDATEALGCGLGRTSAPVTAGDRLFVRVAGLDPEDVSDLTLSLRSRAANVCADGHRDAAEHCDDGNDQPGDGCDDACAVESSEAEPNDTLETASLSVSPYYAEIGPAGDVDMVQVDLAEPATLIAETQSLGDDACARGTLDSYLELLDASGDVLAENDDGGDGYCARVSIPDAQAGRYFVRVSAASGGTTPTFPYRLVVGLGS
jgi:cysteine-rich repeat protein